MRDIERLPVCDLVPVRLGVPVTERVRVDVRDEEMLSVDASDGDCDCDGEPDALEDPEELGDIDWLRVDDSLGDADRVPDVEVVRVCVRESG